MDLPPRALVACLLAVALVAGCTSTQVTGRRSNIGDEKLPRPAHIWVYDFAATPADVPPDTVLAAQMATSRPQTPEQIQLGRKLGAEVAQDLTAELRAFGAPAQRAMVHSVPALDDLVIHGAFVGVDPGSTAGRMLVGFGAGSAELKTLVEVYQMTGDGLRLLGSGEVASGGSKSPGLLLPVAVTVATANPIGIVVGGAVKAATELSGSQNIEAAGQRTAEEIAVQLKARFREQGWVRD